MSFVPVRRSVPAPFFATVDSLIQPLTVSSGDVPAATSKTSASPSCAIEPESVAGAAPAFATPPRIWRFAATLAAPFSVSNPTRSRPAVTLPSTVRSPIVSVKPARLSVAPAATVTTPTSGSTLFSNSTSDPALIAVPPP